MAKKIWNVTSELAESLNYQCPNCGGEIEHKYKATLRCPDCGYSYEVQTRNERLIIPIMYLGIFAFMAGLFLDKIFQALL